MPIQMLDFTDVSSEGFEPLEPADYNATIFEAKPGTSKAGQPKLSIVFKIQDGDYKGRQQWLELSLQKQALWKVKGFLLAAGYPSEKMASGFELDTADLVGRPIVIRVGTREYNGTQRNEVTNTYAPGSVPTEAGGKSGGF